VVPIIAVLVIGVAVTGTVIISGLLLFGASQPATAADAHTFRPSPYQPMPILTKPAPAPDGDTRKEAGPAFSTAA